MCIILLPFRNGKGDPEPWDVFEDSFSKTLKWRRISPTIKNVTKKKSYDVIICDHGIYLPQGVITEISKKLKIKIYTFNTGYRKKTFLFARGDSYHFSIPRDKEFLKTLLRKNNAPWKN